MNWKRYNEKKKSKGSIEKTYRCMQYGYIREVNIEAVIKNFVLCVYLNSIISA
jgi:hypothetical protein